MSLRSTKSRIQGKIASGGFNQPDNTLAKAIDTGAGIMAKGIMTRAAEEREEKRIAKREAAAEARRLAAAQAKKEAEAKKLARNAKVLAQDFTGTTDNAAAVTYFQNQLELMDGDVGAVVASTENRIKGNQLKFVPPTTEMVDTPFQGPNMEANPKISDLGVGFGGPNGKIETGSNLGPGGTTSQTDEAFRVSDVAKIAADPTSDYSTQAQEMLRIFEERGTPLEGTTLPEDGSVEVNTPGGVVIKPFVKQSEIDWANISSEEVDNLIIRNDSGVEPLNDEDLKKATNLQNEFAQNEVPNIMNNYLGAGSPAAITAALSQVENDPNLTAEEKTTVKKSLIANRNEMLAAAEAARNSTKNASKTPEVMALEAYMETEEFKKMTAGEKAALTVNFGSIFKPTYSSVEEAIAAYNTANTLGEGYESQVSRIEAVINKAYGGNSERVFAVDEEGFGRIYFVSKAFDPETNSVESTTDSGDTLPTNIIPMADYDADKARSERKTIESDLAKYNKGVSSFLTLSSTMADIVDIARQNDGVLTWTAKTMKNIATVTGEVDTFLSVLDTMKPNGDGRITREAYEEQLKAKGLLGKNETLDTVTLDATPPTTLTSWVFGGEDNQLIAARRALEAKLALAPFKVGNAEGTTGTAMSNQDRDLFMKFLTVFRGADGLEKNFVEYLRTTRDELDNVVQRFLPGSSEFESFKDSYGYYPAKGFAKTLSEYVEDHPNKEKFLRILNGLSTGSISSQGNNKPPAVTLEKFRSDFLLLNPVINMTKEIEDIILENYNLQYGGSN